jgi:hypothetical protein
MSGAPASRVKIEPARATGGGHVRRDARDDALAGLAAPSAAPLVPAAAVLVPPAVARVAPPPIPVPRPAESDDDDRSEPEVEVDHGAAMVSGAGASAPSPPAGTGPRLQRSSLPELWKAMTTPDKDEDGGWLVDDATEKLTDGQMRKSAFLKQLRTEVHTAADEELSAVHLSAAGCPYLDQMLRRYHGRSAAEVERSVRRYAPEARGVKAASEYIPYVVGRLRRGIRKWIETRKIPDDLPSEEMQSFARAGGWIGAIAGLAGVAPPKDDEAEDGDVPEKDKDQKPKRKALGPSPGRVDGGALVRRLGPGAPLDGTTRARMEHALGHSFAAVRIHADDRAAGLSRDLGARAFTLGSHVALGAGAPAPGTIEGDALLAHELAHVAQQGPGTPTGDVPVGEAEDALERDADEAAAHALAQLHAERNAPATPRRRRSGLALQRCTPAFQPRVPADLEKQLPIVADLRKRFNVGVREDDANWDADLLQGVADALATLSDAERAAVSGVTFVRVRETKVKGGDRDAQAVHHFDVSSQPGQPPVDVKEIMVGDSATSLRREGLVSLIIHELGHGIEESVRTEARFQVFQAEYNYNQAFDANNRSHMPFADAYNAFGSKKYPDTEIRAARPFLTPLDDAAKAYQELRALAGKPDDADVVAQHGALDAALTSALARRDAEWAKLTAAPSDSALVADGKLLLPKFDAAVADLRKLIDTRVRRKAAADADTKAIGAIGGHEVPARLVAFKQVVDAESIEPLSWPHTAGESYTANVRRVEHDKPWRYYEEMFAEAFAMWKTDKQALHDQAPALERWFDQGNHLK